MAIEIVPKREIKVPPWQNFLLYFCIFLLFCSIIGYFALAHFIKQSEQKLQEVNTEIEKAEVPERKALKERLLSLREKIEDFAPLLFSHKKSSNFFGFLEKNTHPKVFFTDLKLNTNQNNVELSGQTEDFQTLGQQLLIFQETEFIQNLKLSEIKISKEGKVEFTFTFSLDPKLFTP